MLKDFLKFSAELQGWIRGGFKEHKFFRANCGICTNWSSYCCVNSISSYPVANRWLSQHFEDMGYEPISPFTESFDYFKEKDNGILWANEKRLAFIHEHAKLWRQLNAKPVCNQ